MLPVKSDVIALAASPGQIVVWGNDDHRQISSCPRRGGFKKIAPGGATQGLGLGSDGIPFLWGGYLPPNLPIVPTLELPPGETYVDIALGASFAAGIRASNGGIDTWGGVYADGSGKADVPTSFAGIKFIALTVGGGHGVAITEDQQLEQWSAAGPGSPPKPQGTKFVEVRARTSYSLARDDQGRLYGWGKDLFAPQTTGSSPLNDPLWQFTSGYWWHPGPFTAMAAGPKPVGGTSAHVLALRPNGTVVGWGANVLGERDDAPAGVTFIAIAAGQSFSIGLDSDGRLHHWGNPMQVMAVLNTEGHKPVELLGAVPEGRFSAISAGTKHASALRRDVRVDPDDVLERVVRPRPVP